MYDLQGWEPLGGTFTCEACKRPIDKEAEDTILVKNEIQKEEEQLQHIKPVAGLPQKKDFGVLHSEQLVKLSTIMLKKQDGPQTLSQSDKDEIFDLLQEEGGDGKQSN